MIREIIILEDGDLKTKSIVGLSRQTGNLLKHWGAFFSFIRKKLKRPIDIHSQSVCFCPNTHTF
jgi:hypothetical protein